MYTKWKKKLLQLIRKKTNKCLNNNLINGVVE